MSNDNYDVEKQVHRESEGQDTITPLTNAFFLKQLGKLKNNSGSNKSINSIQSSSSLNNRQRSSSESEFETKSIAEGLNLRKNSTKKLNIPESFLSIFRSDYKLAKDSEEYQSNNFLNDSFKLSPNLAHKKYADNDLNTTIYSNFTSNTFRQSSQNLSQTDKVFDALSNILNGNASSNQHLNSSGSNNHYKDNNLLFDSEFIQNVKLIVQHSELIKKRKIDKSRFICRLITLLIFFFMFLLICYFLFTLNSIANDFLKNNLKKNQIYEMRSLVNVSNV